MPIMARNKNRLDINSDKLLLGLDYYARVPVPYAEIAPTYYSAEGRAGALDLSA